MNLKAKTIVSLILACAAVACWAVSASGQEILPNDNTRVGDSALISLTTGFDNSAFGYYALSDTTTADNNTGVGAFTLHYNTTGHDNTADGYAALIFNSSGSQNTAVGAYALGNNTTAGNNTATGFKALYPRHDRLQQHSQWRLCALQQFERPIEHSDRWRRALFEHGQQ